MSPGENIALRLEPLLPVTNGTICMPTRYVLAIVPFVTRRPQSSGRDWPGLTGGAASIKLSKLLNQEDALSAPRLRGDFSSPQAPWRRRNAADRRSPLLLTSHYCLLHASHRDDKRRCFPGG